MGVCVGEDRHVLIAFMINLAHNIEDRLLQYLCMVGK